MSSPSGLRLRVVVNLGTAVVVSFGLLTFATVSVVRRVVSDADVSAVVRAADLIAAEIARCPDERCVSSVVSDARGLGLLVTFHDCPLVQEKPQWVPSVPDWPAHVSVERRAGQHVIAVELTLESITRHAHVGIAAIVLAIVFNAVALVVIGMLLLERTVIRRLAQLDEQLGTIERLDLETPLWSSDGGDEIGRMSSTVRRVAEKLREDRRKTRAYIDELQRTNKDLRETREGLARSERLATVGRLAAGVAHEIGNPVAAILGYLAILRNDRGASPAAYVDRLEREAKRVDRIVRDMLDFARSQPLTMGPVDLLAVAAAAARLVQPQPRWRSMKLTIALPTELPLVAAQEHYATQVLLNLLINAADAAEGNGEVTISGRLVDDDVEVDVADDGPGIPPEDAARVFDPFFTTKSPGQGTGLGLAICHRLMESFGGSIAVSRREQHGAVFTLRFRTSQRKADEELHARGRDQKPTG